MHAKVKPLTAEIPEIPEILEIPEIPEALWHSVFSYCEATARCTAQ